jgi:hypothetical protein
LRER